MEIPKRCPYQCRPLQSGAQVTKVKVDVDVDGVVHISCPSASCEDSDDFPSIFRVTKPSQPGRCDGDGLR